MNPQQAYDELVQRSRQLFTIHGISALVGWDQQVFMPPEGIGQRAKMVGYLAELAHHKQVDPRIGQLLDAADAGDWEPEEAANLREWRRDYRIATHLPDELVERRAELTTQATQVWERARAENNYADFAPWLSQLLDLSREVADRLGWETERYDALLDLREPGLTAAQCVTFFGELRHALVPLLDRILASPIKARDDVYGNAHFGHEAQQKLGAAMSAALGFNYRAGRLDVSAHPFTEGISLKDVRLTTRFEENDPLCSLTGTIHETGHGIYEQGLPEAYQGTPVGQVRSLALHESQSRFFENNIGRGRPFWIYWLPRFREAFGLPPDGLDLDEFYLELNRVCPSLIRTEADEVTYNLHIMIRFEIERDLFRDAIQPADLPEVWNSRYKEYLGIDVPNDRLGILQDVHWSWASFGYFPTYSLGTVYAAQLGAALRRDVPDLDSQLASGDFTAPIRWMREHIHQAGGLFPSAELIERATGKPPSTSDYIAYLTRKFGDLYGV